VFPVHFSFYGLLVLVYLEGEFGIEKQDENHFVEISLLFSMHRCAASKLNGEELIRDGGIPLLATLLSRCMLVVHPTTPATEPAAIIVTNVMHTLSVLSQFESGREEILRFGGLVEDIVHSTELELMPSAVDEALQTAAHLSVSAELQSALLRAGFLW
jgi:DnaJ homolog subfamily C member 13